MIPAVVIAAGLGTRLRPLTEHYAKPVLPIDGRPVLSQLLRELASAACPRVTVVSGHLGEQLRQLVGDGSGFDLEVTWARQEAPNGSLDAALAARETPPYLVVGADVLFAPGDLARFSEAHAASGAAGALAVRPQPGSVEIRDGLVERVVGEGGLAAAPLWAIGPALQPYVAARPGAAPYELATAFQHAIDAGERVVGVEIGATRDLTTPLDLLEQNFAYLSSL